jgi:hypothetical protein
MWLSEIASLTDGLAPGGSHWPPDRGHRSRHGIFGFGNKSGENHGRGKLSPVSFPLPFARSMERHAESPARNVTESAVLMTTKVVWRTRSRESKPE